MKLILKRQHGFRAKPQYKSMKTKFYIYIFFLKHRNIFILPAPIYQYLCYIYIYHIINEAFSQKAAWFAQFKSRLSHSATSNSGTGLLLAFSL